MSCQAVRGGPKCGMICRDNQELDWVQEYNKKQEVVELREALGQHAPHETRQNYRS